MDILLSRSRDTPDEVSRRFSFFISLCFLICYHNEQVRNAEATQCSYYDTYCDDTRVYSKFSFKLSIKFLTQVRYARKMMRDE